ncbi:toprim domain-containing protein [Kribbella yunnanensis]
MHRAARDFYERQLHELPDGWAAGHLRERGLGGVVADETWRIGYAPDTWAGLTSYLRRHGFGDDDLVAGGLATPTINGYLVDRFRDRIMFAADDIDFETVGFVGRARSGRVRYLNSPTTEIYHKGETLVGLTAQRGKLFCGSIPVLVEGPMDALAVDQLGGRWAGISTCGTAVTRQHAVMIRQLSLANQIVVAFDADLGGRLGAVRSLDSLTEIFASVRVAELPPGLDPAAAFQESKDGLSDCLGSARPLVEFAVDVELAKWDPVLDHVSGQVNALRAVAPLVRQMPSNRMAQQIAGLAERLNLEVEIVSREVLSPVVRRGAKPRSGRRSRGVDPVLADEPDRGPTP